MSEGLKEEFNLDEQTQNEIKRILILPTIYPFQKKYEKVANVNTFAILGDHEKAKFDFEENVETGNF